MPEGKKTAVPAPKPVREEDLYSAKTHLHQPVPVQETATVSATAQLADAPEGALPSEVRPEIVTWEKLCEAIKASGRSYNMEMIEKAYNLANTAHKGVCRRSGEPYICHPLAVARLVLDLGMDSESIAAALLHDVVEDTPTTLDDLNEDGDAFLLPHEPVIDGHQDAVAWIEKRWKGFFEYKLAGWYTDESLWPKNRTLKMFREWFAIEYRSMVWDLDTTPLEYEDWSDEED